MSAIIAFLGLRGTIAAGIALLLAIAAGVQTARLWNLQAETAGDAAELAAARDANRAWQAVAEAAEAERQKAEAARKAQAEQAAQAIEDARELAKEALAELEDFRDRWTGRPRSCAIALTQMEAACESSLSDY